jgi:hypothetical protein
MKFEYLPNGRVIKMIETSHRKTLFSELKSYCHSASDHDFIEVSHWSNGEGVDVIISRKRGEERFCLTWGEWELLQVLMHYKGE